MGGGGGLVKSRDFVNLRCYRVVENGQIMTEQEMRTKGQEIASKPERRSSLSTVHEQSEGSSVKSDAMSSLLNESYQSQSMIVGSVGNSIGGGSNFAGVIMNESGRGRGTSNSGDLEGDGEDSTFSDCDNGSGGNTNRVYISAARSVVYPGYPPGTKYLRGENIITCFATRDVAGHPNECVFEWLLCLDLKGYIMASVLDTVS